MITPPVWDAEEDFLERSTILMIQWRRCQWLHTRLMTTRLTISPTPFVSGGKILSGAALLGRSPHVIVALDGDEGATLIHEAAHVLAPHDRHHGRRWRWEASRLLCDLGVSDWRIGPESKTGVDVAIMIALYRSAVWRPPHAAEQVPWTFISLPIEKSTRVMTPVESWVEEAKRLWEGASSGEIIEDIVALAKTEGA